MASQPSSQPLTAEQWAAKAYAALETIARVRGESAVMSEPIVRLLGQAPDEVAIQGSRYIARMNLPSVFRN